MTITIVNSGIGNIRSVVNAFEALGWRPRVCNYPNDLKSAELIVLPGVGAFADGMHNLREGGWVDALEEKVKKEKKLFLGICLGMQMLATTGTEHTICPGLNWIPGIVERIKSDDPTLRIPHIGWNDVFIKAGDMYVGLGESQCFYFLNSYVFRPEDPAVITGTCIYGLEFAASVQLDNIYGVQYHPEKSQQAGLKVLKNLLTKLSKNHA